MTNRPTCGVLYQRALSHFTGMDPECIAAFAPGFICGQAEKVYLGACSAAMFRPSPEYRPMVEEAVRFCALVYGLEPQWLGDEVWLVHSDPATWASMGHLRELRVAGRENSPEWHRARALLCGVPWKDVDVRFHEREGFNEPCDRPVGGA